MSSSQSTLAMKVRPSLVPVSFLLALAAGDRAWAQQTEAAKLFPPSKFDTSITGSDVAISGAWALVGDHTAGDGGQVYFFRRGPSGWTMQQAERSVPGTTFGSVAIDGETAVVGDHLWDFGNTWRGKAYVYERQGGSWLRVQNLLPAKLDDWSVFGWDVAVSGDVIVVGAPGADAVIKDGGEVFIYERVKGVWALVKRLQLPSVPKTLSWDYRFLGASVAVHGDLMVAGAPGKTGAAFVYERGPTGWSRIAVLEDPTPKEIDAFGRSVGISGNTIVVGEPVDVDSNYRRGAAFIFERDGGGSWKLQQEIRASDGFVDGNLGFGDEFGHALAIDGERIVVGMPHGRIQGTNTGTAYLFVRGPNGWPATETKQFVGSDAAGGHADNLGHRIALSGGFIVAGAPGATVPSGITGSAYVFEVELGKDFCAANPNSTGKPARLVVTGSLHADDRDLTLSVRDCPAGTVGVFLMSPSRVHRPLGDGWLCLGSPLRRLLPAVVTGAGGHATYDLDFGDPSIAGSLTAGSTWYFQFWYQDPTGGPAGSNLSNALALTLQ